MPLPSFRRIDSEDRAVNTVQDMVETLFGYLRGKPHIDARLVRNVVLGAVPARVSHGLGRKLSGWIVSRKDGFADVKEVPDAAPERFVSLVASDTVTVDLMVF